MKVSKRVIDQYKVLCRHSAAKCSNDTEIVLKAQRAITLGQVIEIRDGGDTLVVRYYDLDYTIKNNKITNLRRDRSKDLVIIKEDVKQQYTDSFQYIAAKAFN